MKVFIIDGHNNLWYGTYLEEDNWIRDKINIPTCIHGQVIYEAKEEMPQFTAILNDVLTAFKDMRLSKYKRVLIGKISHMWRATEKEIEYMYNYPDKT